jgi:hypothetical protein
MWRELTRLLVVPVVGLLCVGSGLGAPKPAETPTDKRDKAVKEFVAQLLTALGRHDFDTFIGLCEVPFNIQPSGVASGIRTDKDSVKEQFAQGYSMKPKFDGSQHVVRSIRTLKEAKQRFLEQQAADAAAVLTDEGLVVHVELRRDPKPTHLRLLVREKDGQLRLVGIQPAEKNE